MCRKMVTSIHGSDKAFGMLYHHRENDLVRCMQGCTFYLGGVAPTWRPRLEGTTLTMSGRERGMVVLRVWSEPVSVSFPCS